MPIALHENSFDLPPFPDDVPTAPLLRLSLKHLLQDEEQETQRLWTACTKLGFFYLDIDSAALPLPQTSDKLNDDRHNHKNSAQSTSTQEENFDPAPAQLDNNTKQKWQAYLQDVHNLFSASEDFFTLPLPEKQRYDFKDRGSYFGYKGYGAGIIDAAGTRDRNEFYNIAKDHVLHLPQPTEPSLPVPQAMMQHEALLERFIRSSHEIVVLILRRLNGLLGLHPGTLENLHGLEDASGDQVRFVRSPPQKMDDRQTALGAHTDFGSVTVLFNRLGGLQVLPPTAASDAAEGKRASAGRSAEGGDEQWLYVKPLPGHAVINLGDALVKFTDGVLRSNLHRVVNPPGDEQGKLVRHSLVYFSRPRDDVVLKKLQGVRIVDDGMREKKSNLAEVEEQEDITAKDWTLRRAFGRRGIGDWGKTVGTEYVK